jgi:oxygen-independent coproporphyrinogen-3 oxidase
MPRYTQALLREAALYQKQFEDYRADTVYIGGGTPSCLPEGSIRTLVTGLRDFLHIEDNAQITIEANPGTISPEKLAEYRQSGVNRISIGMQTDDDALLQTLGRIHSHAQFLDAYGLARQAGFDDISVDLMFGLPGQSLQTFQHTLQNTIAINPEHISVYSLKLEPGTPFYQTYHGREIIGEAEERAMYHAAVRLLKKAGYRQYETSNFAKKGHESRHNMKYWQQGEYLGLGCASHSYYEENAIIVRAQNTAVLDDYLHAAEKGEKPVAEENIISEKELMEEYIMLRLRLGEGIAYADFHQRFGLDFPKMFKDEINKLENARLIHADDTHIRPLIKGFDLQNALILEFIKKL